MSSLTDYSKFDHLTEDSDDDNENDHVTHKAATKKTATAAPAPEKQSDKTAGGIIRRDESSGRYRFEYNGSTVYEFEQSLDDVTIYILPPPYVTKGNQINCVISANHFKLGLVGHGESGKCQFQWFLNEGTYGTVDVDESTWTLEDYDFDDSVRTNNNNNNNTSNNNNSDRRKIIVVTLTKANRGTVWEAALRGNPNAAAAAGATHKTTKTTTGSTTDGTSTSTTMDPISKEQVKKDLMLQRFQEENPGFDFSGADFNGSIPDARDFMGGVKYQ
jgi:hypothetical protein